VTRDDDSSNNNNNNNNNNNKRVPKLVEKSHEGIMVSTTANRPNRPLL